MERSTMLFSWLNQLFRLGQLFKFANCKRLPGRVPSETGDFQADFKDWTMVITFFLIKKFYLAYAQPLVITYENYPMTDPWYWYIC
jgi:hypothetical protein